MTSPAITFTPSTAKTRLSQLTRWLLPFFTGILFPLSFAPFHFPGLALLSLALFYLTLQNLRTFTASLYGLVFGLGCFGLGVSWVYVSIHAYGHLHPLLAGLITLIFLLYLSLYTSVFAWIFVKLKRSPCQSALMFSSLWILIEYTRATFLTGFPWLLLGLGQFDSPFKSFLPIFGVYGTGFITAFTAICFAHSMSPAFSKRLRWLCLGLTLLFSPYFIANHPWTKPASTQLSVGLIQANLSMRDKWDERLFWSILHHYEKQVNQLLGTQLIVMPESAIPLPAHYVTEFLEKLHQSAKKSNSALIFGMPAMQSQDGEAKYYNALYALGQAKGIYLKQHLVPFGEYIPHALKSINNLLGIPDPGISPGEAHQALVHVQNYPMASLICYELAYSELLRAQLPQAQWIISISDDGWFGHSLAMYQQLQIAQVRSLQTGRYQVVSNNDGLSSVLNTQGDIVASLPAFSADILRATITPTVGLTPWARIGDLPILIFIGLILVGQMMYSKQHSLAQTPD